jgi:hypothetical protein
VVSVASWRPPSQARTQKIPMTRLIQNFATSIS